jgi:hypothetical protein
LPPKSVPLAPLSPEMALAFIKKKENYQSWEPFLKENGIGGKGGSRARPALDPQRHDEETHLQFYAYMTGDTGYEANSSEDMLDDMLIYLHRREEADLYTVAVFISQFFKTYQEGIFSASDRR